jgi:hypothetical protein
MGCNLCINTAGQIPHKADWEIRLSIEKVLGELLSGLITGAWEERRIGMSNNNILTKPRRALRLG